MCGFFTWTTSGADGSGIYAVSVRATDDGTLNLDDFKTLDITVNEVNQTLVADAGSVLSLTVKNLGISLIQFVVA